MAITSGEAPEQDRARPWNRQVLRAMNERVLLERLREAGTSSRAELARITGLSKPTVSAALANLEHDGLVRRIGETSSGRGRAAILYEPDPTAGYVVGLDVGRDWLRAAVADLDGSVVGRRDAPNTARDADDMVTATIKLARQVVADADLEWSRVVHAVVGSPGVNDRGNDTVRYAVNLPGWGRPGLPERFSHDLGVGFELANDANLAALGEYTFGAGRGSPLFVYLHVGTGVGAGIVSGGRLFHGAHGAAGEIGYLPLPGAPAPARRPNRDGERLPVGALESATGGEGVAAAGRAAGLRAPDPARPLTAHDVFEMARQGDPNARAVVEGEAERLAHAVAALVVVLDPELVVLGGGIGRNEDLLFEPLETRLEALVPQRPRLAASELGADAVLYGALATATSAARERVFADRFES